MKNANAVTVLTEEEIEKSRKQAYSAGRQMANICGQAEIFRWPNGQHVAYGANGYSTDDVAGATFVATLRR